MQLPPDWQVTPMAVAALALGITHEVGLVRLSERQTPVDRWRTRRRSLAFYAALFTLVLVASGPLERWGMKWLSIHMVVHVVEMFYLPPLLIVGAPWVPLLFALPVQQRRWLLRKWYLVRSTRCLRKLWGLVSSPFSAVVLFNGVMVLWHVPAVFNFASWHDWAMEWLMAPSFVVSGVLFWRVLVSSHPWGPKGSLLQQALAVVVTGFEMLVLAMALGIFTKDPWYSMNVALLGRVDALRDQRLAAGILWVCGDFWAVPSLVLIGYRLYRQRGGLSVSFERALGRA
ncbi:MAG TPA: cytochrome c oxidase assembly protein [Acidimicrobiales bacterium]|nr:cytochrome c oxidase assembly protein [Acidimicrobiales bacterium]